MWDVPATKEIGWRGRIYRLTDSDTNLNSALTVNRHLRPHQPMTTSSAFPFCQGLPARNMRPSFGQQRWRSSGCGEQRASRVPFPASHKMFPGSGRQMVERWFGRDAQTRTRDASAPDSRRIERAGRVALAAANVDKPSPLAGVHPPAFSVKLYSSAFGGVVRRTIVAASNPSAPSK
jgi:hypothetical protein